MNTPGLFIVGAVVTLIVLAAALLVFGALLDGRDIDEASKADAARAAAPEDTTAPVG